jgi:hypothetical protein
MCVDNNPGIRSVLPSMAQHLLYFTLYLPLPSLGVIAGLSSIYNFTSLYQML